MLELYFVKPDTVDRIRGSWIGEPIERYVVWLTEQGYTSRSICRRVPILVHFGEFARRGGAKAWDDLPLYIAPFVDKWIQEHGKNCKSERARKGVGSDARNPIQQMLNLVVPGYRSIGRSCYTQQPFSDRAGGFFVYLREERGLRETSIRHYWYYLRRLEAYLKQIEIHDLGDLSPVVLSAFVTENSRCLSKTSLRGLCSSLRVFLRYLYRERLIPRDLSYIVESPQRYRLSDIPRSITWAQVRRMLDAVDRRTPMGKRDYAILLLLATYGLRAREVARLTLDDIDWRRERLRIPERKAGHSTAYPLSPIVGEAIVDYLRHGRPETPARHVFFRVLAPRTPLTYQAISGRASYYLHKAGIPVARPGSHTLRHTCVQRLVDASFTLKMIGDYVGHRSSASTEIYTKVAVDALRDVALGDGEVVL